MASVRIAQLLEQRRAARGLQFGDKRRVLTPANTTISSIAKRTASAELDVNVSKYNAGEISNEDMRAFLTKMQSNPGITGQDKIDIDNQVRDFDSRVQKDKLEATYKSAPDNSLAQYQAAQALSSYHQARAGSMIAGTPAHSQALENVAQWQQQSQSIQKSMATTARQNLRYNQEQQINQLPNSSSERSTARAEMYKKLYDQAVVDGDSTDANKYAAAYQQEITNAQQQAQQEADQGQKQSAQAEKNDLRGILGQLQNDYHDGKINEAQYLQTLNEISPRVDATNDYGLINTLNRTTDIVYKNQSKGGVKRATTAGGLPVVTGKGKAGGGGSAETNWDTEDFNYSDNLKYLTEKLNKGEMDSKTYAKSMSDIVEVRNAELETRIQAVHDTAAENPNAKIYYNGKKQRAADILDSLYKEQDDIGSQYDAVQNGKFGLVMVEPGQFNASGDVTKKGKSQASLQIIDTRNLPKGRYAKDTEGVFHEIQKAKTFLQPEQMANAINGVYTSADGKSYYVKTDQSGNPYVEGGGQFVNVYEPGSANLIKVDLSNLNGNVDPNTGVKYATDQKDENGNLIVKSYGSILGEHKDALLKGLKTAGELQNPTSALSQAKKLEQVKQVKQTKQEQGGLLNTVAKAILPPDATNPLGTLNAVKGAVKPVLDAAKPVADAIHNVVAPKVPDVIKPASPAQINMPNVKLPELKTPQLYPTQSASQPIALPQLRVAGQTQPNAIQQAAKTQNLKVAIPQETKAFQAAKNVQPNPQGVFLNNVIKGAQGIGTKILSFFGGKK